ncbi:MAG: HAMP domain-containing sensor histidine kinase, partial [Verrucomicrobiota bacterium]
LTRRRFAFASAVTHELRTPLTSFQLYTDMLAKEVENGSEKAQRHVHTLTEQNRRLQRLVNHVMAYAKLERGQFQQEKTRFKVLDLATMVICQLESRAEEKDMCLILKYGQDLTGFEVEGTPGGIEQILINLIENAIKYADSAEDKRIHLNLSKSGRQIHFEVRDHGPGIPAVERRRCFRPFMKSVHRVSETEGGLGLGLSISRGLARQMGGKLSYVNPPDGGACFRLSLPTS